MLIYSERDDIKKLISSTNYMKCFRCDFLITITKNNLIMYNVSYPYNMKSR